MLLVKQRREQHGAWPQSQGKGGWTSPPHLSPIPAGQASIELLGKSLHWSTRPWS